MKICPSGHQHTGQINVLVVYGHHYRRTTILNRGKFVQKPFKRMDLTYHRNHLALQVEVCTVLHKRARNFKVSIQRGVHQSIPLILQVMMSRIRIFNHIHMGHTSHDVSLHTVVACWSILTPALINNFTTSKCPFQEARINAVYVSSYTT